MMNAPARRAAHLPVAGLAVAAVLGGQPACGHVIVCVEPGQQEVQLGSTFNVDIIATMDLPILGWGLDLAIADETVLSFAGPPQIGDAWWAADARDQDDLAGLAFPDPVMGEVLLARLELTADALGESVLELGITQGDLTEGFALVQPGMFDTYSLVNGFVTVVPAPATGVLLAALWFSRPRRRTG